MITVSKQENGVLFTFQDSDKYLYGSGTIEVPFNSLSIIQDESDNITLRKSASNDIFLSARFDTDFGYASKEEAVNALKEILYDEAGISEEEVQQMIDAATSGIPSSEVVEQLRRDVNAVSGEVDTKVDTTTYESGQYATAQALNALQENKLDASAYTPTDLSQYWTSGQTQQAINAATSGIPSSQVIEQLQTDVSNLQGETNDIWDTIDEKEEVIASALTQLNQNVSAIDAKEEVIASALTEVRQDVENKQDALTAGSGIEISGNVISATGGALFVDFDDLMENMNDEKWDELVDAIQNNKPIFYVYDYSEGDIADAGQSPVDGYVYINEGEESTEIGLKKLYGGGYRDLIITKNGSEDYEVTDDYYDYQPMLQAGSGIIIDEDNVISVTVDSELDETSNNPVANSAITNAIINNEYTVSQAINSLNNRVTAVESGGTGGGITSGEVQTMINDSLDIYWTSAQTQTAIDAAISGKVDTSAVTAVNDALTAHTANTTVHVTSVEKDAWNAKANIDHVTQAEYDVMEQAGTLDSNTMYIIDDAVPFDPSTKVDVSAITTAITSFSTNSEVAGAKAVYDAIQAGGGVTVDSTLNTGSTNPVANSAITNVLSAYYYAIKTNNSVYNNPFNKKSSNGCVGFSLGFSNIANPNDSSTGGLWVSKINNKDIIGTDYLAPNSNTFNLSLVETSAITTSMTSSSTDAQVPSAKAVYDTLGGLKFVKLTQSEYDNLATKDSSTLYIISD